MSRDCWIRGNINLSVRFWKYMRFWHELLITYIQYKSVKQILKLQMLLTLLENLYIHNFMCRNYVHTESFKYFFLKKTLLTVRILFIFLVNNKILQYLLVGRGSSLCWFQIIAILLYTVLSNSFVLKTFKIQFWLYFTS